MRSLLCMIFVVSSLFNTSAALSTDKKFTSRLVPDNAEETAEQYFPADAWGASRGGWTQAERSRFYERWFGGQLAAMKEPSLAFGDHSAREANEIRLLFLSDLLKRVDAQDIIQRQTRGFV